MYYLELIPGRILKKDRVIGWSILGALARSFCILSTGRNNSCRNFIHLSDATRPKGPPCFIGLMLGILE
jgi:hypothetical protein